MSDSAAVRIGYAGAAYIGAVGAVAPINPKVAWDADDWTDLGYIGTDGLGESVDQNRAEFFAWGFPNAPVRTQINKDKTAFKLVFLETNANSLSLYHRVSLDDMTSTAAASGVPQFITFQKALAPAPDIRALGIDVIDGTHLHRIVIPKCEVTERGDLVYKDDTLVQFDMTFTPILSSDGVSYIRMISDITLPA